MIALLGAGDAGRGNGFVIEQATPRLCLPSVL